MIHAGKYTIACQYCHADARRSEYAGLPSVERCMGYHKIIGAQDNPEIGKLHEYWRRGQAIPWVRVFKVPEFTLLPAQGLWLVQDDDLIVAAPGSSGRGRRRLIVPWLGGCVEW